jgi:anti-sigma factor RsiW
MSAILRAAADGELTPDEATAIASLIETRRHTIETLELEQRIARLEQNRKTPR